MNGLPIRQIKKVPKFRIPFDIGSFSVGKFLTKYGFNQEEQYTLKTLSKALVITYVVFGGANLYKAKYPLDEETTEEVPAQEEVSTERMLFPYPRQRKGEGKEEAVEMFVLKGGVSESMNEAKGFEGLGKELGDVQKERYEKKFDEEALKLWLKMRGEVAHEIQEKGVVVA